jgi:O-antigen/teichoic acid export membrane protein
LPKLRPQSLTYKGLSHAENQPPNSTASSKSALPEGTVSVGIGLFIAGVSAYVFFKIGQQALGQDGFKPIVAMWFTAFALIPGFFLPIEQEVGRALSHRRANGQGGLPIVKRVSQITIIIFVALCVVVLVLSSQINSNLFDGNGVVTWCLLLSLATYAPMHLARGICSGNARFGSYGLIIGLDGAVRVLSCAALWIAGVTNIGAYALTIALSPVVGVLIAAFAGKLKTENGPEASWAEVTPNLGWLLLGSLFAAALVNAGPITVDILGNDAPPELVTRFGNAVIFARIPLYLFQAVQAALLPRLARLAAQRKLSEFKRGLKQLLILVVSVGVLGTIGAFVIGPWVLELVYEGGIDRRTLTLLAFASALYMLALAIAQAVIALSGHARVALGWCAGFGTFVVVAWLSSNDLYLRVELALVASSLVSLAIFVASLKQKMSGNAIFDDASIIDALAERPLE